MSHGSLIAAEVVHVVGVGLRELEIHVLTTYLGAAFDDFKVIRRHQDAMEGANNGGDGRARGVVVGDFAFKSIECDAYALFYAVFFKMEFDDKVGGVLFDEVWELRGAEGFSADGEEDGFEQGGFALCVDSDEGVEVGAKGDLCLLDITEVVYVDAGEPHLGLVDAHGHEHKQGAFG